MHQRLRKCQAEEFSETLMEISSEHKAREQLQRGSRKTKYLLQVTPAMGKPPRAAGQPSNAELKENEQ